ncbi:hypothetical protein HBB16_01380 [Pseudonocardia sp. MCCB 268]|nr:hypothetical protein [Pseudonocardia cytotoxica]
MPGLTRAGSGRPRLQVADGARQQQMARPLALFQCQRPIRYPHASPGTASCWSYVSRAPAIRTVSSAGGSAIRTVRPAAAPATRTASPAGLRRSPRPGVGDPEHGPPPTRTSGSVPANSGGYAGRSTAEAGRGSGIPGYGPMMGAGPRRQAATATSSPPARCSTSRSRRPIPVLGPDQDQR